MSDPEKKRKPSGDDLEELIHDPDGHAVKVQLPDGRIIDERHTMIRARRIPDVGHVRMRREVEFLVRGLEDDPGKIDRFLVQVRHGVIRLLDHPDRKWVDDEIRILGDDDHDLTVSIGPKTLILDYGVERSRMEGGAPPIPREIYEGMPGAALGSAQHREELRRTYGGHKPDKNEPKK